EWITKANHVLKERLQCIKISFVLSVTNPRFTNGAQCYLFLVYWKLHIPSAWTPETAFAGCFFCFSSHSNHAKSGS
ncbi:unnamed protein product, partial [Arabidopsis halleri]